MRSLASPLGFKNRVHKITGLDKVAAIGACVWTGDMNQSAIDLTMMRRCIELSAAAVGRQELPFACVICRDGEVVTEAINRVVQDGDVTRHAEILAISEAQRRLGRSDLSDCQL